MTEREMNDKEKEYTAQFNEAVKDARSLNDEELEKVINELDRVITHGKAELLAMRQERARRVNKR